MEPLWNVLRIQFVRKPYNLGNILTVSKSLLTLWRFDYLHLAVHGWRRPASRQKVVTVKSSSLEIRY